jgi:hypothetical protein
MMTTCNRARTGLPAPVQWDGERLNANEFLSLSSFLGRLSRVYRSLRATIPDKIMTAVAGGDVRA